MKQVTFMKEKVNNDLERDTRIYWNLCHGVRKNTITKDSIESTINFVVASSKTMSPLLAQKFLELREKNRKNE